MSGPAFLRAGGALLHHALRAGAGRSIVLANSLGTDLRLWDAVLPLLPDAPVLRWDMRGHGLSDGPATGIEGYAADLAALMDAHALRGALVCGVSMGGMVAQALAHARPDLCAGLVLACTGARIGTPEAWDARIAAVRADGLESIADGVMERWFAPAWRAANPDALRGWRLMLARTPSEGYAAACAAIRDADLAERTAALRLPALCIAGSEDGATPPPVVETLAALIPGARLEVLEGAGHLPPIERPKRLADLIARAHAALP